MRILIWVVIILFVISVFAALILFLNLPKPIGAVPELQTELFNKPKNEIVIKEKFIYKSATELASMIKRGEATSFEIVSEHINHIKNNNWKTNAIVWLREKEALLEALEADSILKTGDTSKALLGIPVTVKEQFMVKGLPSTLNAKRFGIVAEEDAEVVKELKRAGAIILGTTNLSFMVSYNETFGEIYPTGNNPYDTSLTPGGSTGGGAVSVVEGFAPLSLGADAGGSIRIPAAFCGVYGLKPTYGAVNVTEGVMPFHIMKGNKFGIAHAGPLARTAEDLELLWKVLIKTKIDKKNQKNIQWQRKSGKQLGEYKVAWIDEWYREKGKVKVGKDVKMKLQTLIKLLNENGVTIKKDSPGLYDEMLKVWGGMIFQITTQDESWLVRKIIKMGISKQDDNSGVFEDFYKSLDDNSVERWNELLKRQKQLIKTVEEFFETHDFLILPVTYGVAFSKCEVPKYLLDENKEKMHYIEYFPYTGVFNATGHPAVSVPMGLNEDGLPIGIQVVGALNSDPELLHFLKLIEPLIFNI